MSRRQGWCSLRLFFFPLLAVFFSGACRETPAPGPRAGGELRVGTFHSTPGPINPITTDGGISSSFLDLLFDPLVRVTESGGLMPSIAEKWERSPDGLLLSFHLNPKISFHDGTPLTARDVQYTYEEMRKRIDYYRVMFQSVNEIRVVDDQQLEIRLARPDNFFLDNLGFIGIVPRHLLEGKDEGAWKRFGDHPVGSGPFIFSSQTPEQVSFEPNPAYARGRPYLDRLVFLILPDQRTCLNQLISGRIDMMFLLHAEDFGALDQIPTLRLYENWDPFFYLLALNNENPLFSDVRTRQAINFAIDRSRIIQKTLKGHGEPAYATVPASSSEMPPDMAPYAYDPLHAVSLLKEAGWQDRDGDFFLDQKGRRFEFSVIAWQGEDLSLAVLRLIQQNLQAIGIQMKIETLPLGQLIARVWGTRQYEAALSFLLYRGHHANDEFSWHSRHIPTNKNFTGYHNPKTDAFLDQSRSALSDSARQESLLGFQRELYKDPPGAFLFWRRMPIVAHVKFQGIPEKHMESFRDFAKIWVKDEPYAK